MNILWISNITFGPLCELAGESKSSGGSWLDATFDVLSNEVGIYLSLVTVSRVKEIRTKKEGNHTFYILPGGYPSEYDYKSSKNKEYWEKIKKESCPDLIQIWGTEFTHGYLALQIMKGIPSVVYMQGLMSQIERHYLSGISNKDLKNSISIRDIIKMDWIERQKSRFYHGALIESKMLQMAGNIIVENQWCESHCKAIAPLSKVFRSKLNIKQDFYGQEWSENKMQPHTIMSNAAGYPIKGLHILLKALRIVLLKYPDTQLIIPGEKSPFEKSFFEKLRINGYTKFLIQIIQQLNLKNNICFLNKLSATQMALHMATSNVFVMPSSIENHSSTLIEAMIVGTPCVSSYVGGIPEYLFHNVNGLLYRFDEHEILAAHIIKIFDDNSFASFIGSNAKKAMRDSRKSENLKEELLEIYQKVLKN